MAELSGDLGFLPCHEILRLLSRRAFSGALVARRGTEEKRLDVREGKAVSAASSDPREYVGQILIHGGHLTEDEFEQVYEKQRETRAPLGAILARSGKVPESVVRQALEFKIRETAIELCGWKGGTFTVSSSRSPWKSAGVDIRPLALLDLVEAASERSRAWAAIRKDLPSGAVRVTLAPGAARPPAAPGSSQDRLFRLLEEGRTADELVLDLHATEFQVHARLHALLREGVIRVEGASPPQAPEDGEDPGASDRMARARAALDAGEAERAVQLCRKACEVDASPEAVGLLRESEARLLRILKEELLVKGRKPTVAVDGARIRSLPLSPPERYLLTRMDGARELGAIVRVAPMRELDALELVKRLLRDGLIRA